MEENKFIQSHGFILIIQLAYVKLYTCGLNKTNKTFRPVAYFRTVYLVGYSQMRNVFMLKDSGA